MTRLDSCPIPAPPVATIWPRSSAMTAVGHFTISGDATTVLEALIARHGDFTVSYSLGGLVGSMVMELLCVVVLDMSNTFLEVITEDVLFKWRSAIQKVIQVGFPVSFVVEHIHRMARTFFGQQAGSQCRSQLESVDAKISLKEKELAKLKAKRPKIESDSLSAPPSLTTCLTASALWKDHPLSHGLLG